MAENGQSRQCAAYPTGSIQPNYNIWEIKCVCKKSGGKVLILLHKTLQYNISEYPDEKRTRWNNVKILEKCALIVSWVRFEMGAGVGEGGFLCMIHTPCAKSRNLNSTLSGLNTFPERCYEVKNSKIISPLLSWSEEDRKRQKRREGYFPFTAPLFVLRGLFTILHD